MNSPRPALFTETFHEINGVALTCRQLELFALRTGRPLLNVHPGPHTAETTDGPVRRLALKRSPASVDVDSGLQFDPLLLRFRALARATVAAFGATAVHITAPGDIGILGALVAYDLRLPLLASWHTNLHEFGSRRLASSLRWLPARAREGAASWFERFSLDRLLWFYGIPKLLFAPNPELIDLLASRTKRPVLPMYRGIDTDLFTPARRHRQDRSLVLGFVGRLRPEKNLRLLLQVENALIRAGISDYRFCICGDGTERDWLAANLRRAIFTGYIAGEQLATAYAGMDVFLFPSRTDTYGNVVQEALASGVPAVVTQDGGPKFIVKDGVSGKVTQSDERFVDAALELACNAELRAQMAAAARTQMLGCSWDRVFEGVWNGYAMAGEFRPESPAARAPLLATSGGD